MSKALRAVRSIRDFPSSRAPGGTSSHWKEGAHALLDRKPALDETALSRSEILYVARGSQGKGNDEALRALGADLFFAAPTIATLLFRLRGS